MTWEELFRKWWSRLNEDGGWQIEIVPNQFLDGNAEVEAHYPHRIITFRYNPRSTPSNLIACHEVVHMVVMRLWHPTDDAIGLLGDSTGVVRKHLRDEMEGTVDSLARAFLRAYGESDG